MKYHPSPRVIPEIFIAGIDGSGKSAALGLLISRLNGRYRILNNADELGGFYIHFKGRKEQALKSGLRKAITWLKTVRYSYGLRGLFSLLHFPYWYLESNYLKRYADVDVILYETDTVLHPAAFFAFHFSWMRRFKSSARFKLFHTLFGPTKNSITFYLDTDSRTASERIGRRKTARDGHENPADLERLRREFDEMVRIGSHKIQIVRIDTNNRAIEEVVSEMEAVLKDRLGISLEGARDFT